MKVLLGIDAAHNYRSALALLARLRFENAELGLLHADESVTMPISLPQTPEFFGTAAPVVLSPSGRILLDIAAWEARAANLPNHAIHEAGHAGERLLTEAYRWPADLVAIGSRENHSLAESIFGSVGHALSQDARHSFLIAHGAVAPAGPVRCLFATDHSPFADRALEKFLAWKPGGIKEIIVFSAAHSGSRSHAAPSAECQLAELGKECADMAQAIERRGIPAAFRLRQGHPAAAILEAAEETQVDLIVLGARGHGWMERMFLGSVASEVASKAKLPVLVLRP